MIVLLATANIPLAILIFKGNFDGISSTYLEAAAIDGCTDFQVLVPYFTADVQVCNCECTCGFIHSGLE